MTVWIVHKAYRMDYEIEGVYATKALAEAACDRYNALLDYQRYNPSWTATISEHSVESEGTP